MGARAVGIMVMRGCWGSDQGARPPAFLASSLEVPQPLARLVQMEGLALPLSQGLHSSSLGHLACPLMAWALVVCQQAPGVPKL